MLICIDYGDGFFSTTYKEYQVSNEHAMIIEELCKIWEKKDNAKEKI